MKGRTSPIDTQTDDSVILLDRVSFGYGRQPILEEISLGVRPGEFLGIIGPNGAGKSTMLRLMAGLLRPRNGKVLLFGMPSGHAARLRRRIGYVSQMMQQFHRHSPVTVAEVVGVGRTLRQGIFGGRIMLDRQAVEEALSAVGLPAVRHKAMSELSGGMQQRVLIARALSQEPEILLLDEPTSGMDPHAQQQFYRLLVELHRQRHLTIVLVSHDWETAVGYVDRLAYVNQRLLYHGDVGTFRRQWPAAAAGMTPPTQAMNPSEGSGCV